MRIAGKKRISAISRGLIGTLLVFSISPRYAISDTIFQLETSKEFREKMKIPRNLANFLEDKKCRIKIHNIENFEYAKEKETVEFTTVGFYHSDTNIIKLIEKYTEREKHHEIAHGLWDEIGNDGIFDSIYYKGPTRKEFEKELRLTGTYPLKRDYFLKKFEDIELAEEKAINETFAILFSNWMEGSNTTLNYLFDVMAYKGKGLKSD